MRIWIRLATISTAFAVAGVTAVDAFATQKLAVRQKASGLTLTLTQKATDEQPSTVNVYAPTGYTWNVVRTNGEVIGTAAGTFFLRDAANKPQRFTGNVVAVVPAAAGHQAQWRLDLSGPGMNMRIPAYVDKTVGSETDWGVVRIQFVLPPANVPQKTAGRSPMGAQLLKLTVSLHAGILVPPVGSTVWKGLFTPYARGTTNPNMPGTVEARAYLGPGAVTLRVRKLSNHRISFAGRVTKSGIGLYGATVRIYVNGRSRFTAVTHRTGSFGITRRISGHGRVSVRAAAIAGTRDITSLGCSKSTKPGIACVSATANPFRALSRVLRVRL